MEKKESLLKFINYNIERAIRALKANPCDNYVQEYFNNELYHFREIKKKIYKKTDKVFPIVRSFKLKGDDRVFHIYTCPNCGFESLSDAYTFCPGCGLKINKMGMNND